MRNGQAVVVVLSKGTYEAVVEWSCTARHFCIIECRGRLGRRGDS